MFSGYLLKRNSNAKAPTPMQVTMHYRLSFLSIFMSHPAFLFFFSSFDFLFSVLFVFYGEPYYLIMRMKMKVKHLLLLNVL
jgi:hypothetical protein